MDILIENATGNESKRWSGSAPRVSIPGSGDVVFPAPNDRPLAIGPDHFLATATVVDENIGDDQKRGPEVVTVVGQAVTVTRTVVDKDADDLMADWEGDMALTDAAMPRISEDIIDTMSDTQKAKLPQIVQDRLAAKKVLRGQKPG